MVFIKDNIIFRVLSYSDIIMHSRTSNCRHTFYDVTHQCAIYYNCATCLHTIDYAIAVIQYMMTILELTIVEFE